MAYRFTFSPKEEGRQLATLRVARGDKARNIHGRSEALFKDVPVSFGTDAIVRERRGHRFFAGIRSDPFFFDLAGYLNAMHFTGTDLYRDKNVFSMVLELPNEAASRRWAAGLASSFPRMAMRSPRWTVWESRS